MSEFQVHTIESAPAGSEDSLSKAKQKFGTVPNLIGVLAEAPTAAKAYLQLSDLMYETSFTPTERHVVWFAINFENDCQYCMSAHTGMAFGEKVPQEVIEQARSGEPYADSRLEALRQFTRTLVVNRGVASPQEFEAFLGAGFSKQHVLEIVVAIAHKVLSNYTNHLAETPLDRAFSKFNWAKAPARLVA